MSFSSPDVYNAASRGYDGVKNELFSLGVVLFVITTGKLPFENPTFSDSCYRFIVKGDYNAFWKKHSAIQTSEEFQHLVNRLIAFDPNERYSLQEIKNHPWVLLSNDPFIQEENFKQEFTFRKFIVDSTKDVKNK